MRGPVHKSTFAAIRPTHRLICAQVGADACELIHYGMELVRAERTIQSVLEATYSAVTFHELYTVAARAGMDPKGGRARRRAAGAAWASRRIALKQGTFN